MMRMVVVIAVWSLLPLALAVLSALDGDGRGAAIFGILAAGCLAAALLARSPHRRARLLAVALLVALWIPMAIQTARGFLLASGSAAPAVADSPAGYVIAAVCHSIFTVFPGAFAVGVWRRRSW